MNKEKSDWRTIPGYADYQINQFGEVKSMKFGKERILKQVKTKKYKDNYKYLGVCLYVNNKVKFYNVHVLMGMTFLNYDTANKNLVIDHIDNNGMNNNLSNLQIITHRQNTSKDKKPKLGFTGVKPSGKKYMAQIRINKKFIYLGTYSTPEQAGRAYQDYVSKLNEG